MSVRLSSPENNRAQKKDIPLRPGKYVHEVELKVPAPWFPGFLLGPLVQGYTGYTGYTDYTGFVVYYPSTSFLRKQKRHKNPFLQNR